MEEKKEKPRVGVYVCHCGGNISDYVDVEKVVREIEKEGAAAVVKHVMFACADSSQNEMIADIRKEGLNRLVVAACSPKLHESTLRGVAQKAGLNPYMYYHANIREQSSWAHTDNREEATRKAVRHTRAAISYVAGAEPLEKIKSATIQKTLVVGGGLAGLRAALDISSMGIPVFLVERSPFLGGRLSQVAEVYPYGSSGRQIIRSLVDELMARDNVVIFTNADVRSFSGYVGSFDVEIEVRPRYVTAHYSDIRDSISALPDTEIPDDFNYGLTKRKIVYYPYDGAYPDIPVLDMEHCSDPKGLKSIFGEAVDLDQKAERIRFGVGAVIVSTGFDPYVPKEGEFGYGSLPGVITLPELHRMISLDSNAAEFRLNGRKVRRMAFIYCVGSRQKKGAGGTANEYCSRYCCKATMFTTLTMLHRFRDLKIYHLYRDIRTFGKEERLFDQAGREGVMFLKYSEDEPPVVGINGERLAISVRDRLTAADTLEIPVDAVVLVTGMVPRQNAGLVDTLKLPVGKAGFLQEVHPKLRPVETLTAGVYLGGTCQSPKDTRETLASAEAATSKASTVTLRDSIELEPFVVNVDPAVCGLNRECMAACPYDAIVTKNYEGIGERAWVNTAKCKGCGACVAVCPTEAVQLQGLRNDQIRSMIIAMGREVAV